MRASIITLTAALVALVSAQGSGSPLSKIPPCAQKCLEKYTTGGGIAGCGSLDIPCICGSKEFIDGIGCCLLDECDAGSQQSAITFASQICKTANVDVPTEIICKSQSSAGGSSQIESSTAFAGGASQTGNPTTSAGAAQTSATDDNDEEDDDNDDDDDDNSTTTGTSTSTAPSDKVSSLVSSLTSAAAETGATGAARLNAVNSAGLVAGVFGALVML